MAISRMQQPRQMYGIGGLLKKAARGIKKVVKSPLGKAAIIGGLGWGANKWGNLAQNSTTETDRISSPAQVGTETTWSQTLGTVATMDYAAGAIKTDGTLWMWGYQFYGVLGNNTQNESGGIASPVQLPGTSWARVFGTSNSVVAQQNL